MARSVSMTVTRLHLPALLKMLEISSLNASAARTIESVMVFELATMWPAKTNQSLTSRIRLHGSTFVSSLLRR